ncbi:MAG: SdrD B-like domain-containing protein [Ardenticatenaceae bacterium]
MKHKHFRRFLLPLALLIALFTFLLPSKAQIFAQGAEISNVTLEGPSRTVDSSAPVGELGKRSEAQASVNQIFLPIVLAGGTDNSPPPEDRWTGTLSDEQGEPLTGTVTINGTPGQVSADGSFELYVPRADDERYVINAEVFGYVPVSLIHVGTAIDMNLTLKQPEQFEIDPSQDALVQDTRDTRISIPGGSLVDADGNPATGPLQALVYTYDLTQEEMPGDMSALDSNGEPLALESAGVFYAHFMDEEGNEYNLAPGTQADVSIPLDSSAQWPNVIPLWSYDETDGLWKEEGQATQTNGRFAGSVSHFSYWNFDVEKRDPACIKLTVDPEFLASNSPIQIKAVLLSPTRVRYLNISQLTNVLINLPANTDVEFYMPPSSPTPFATVNTGAPWGGRGLPPRPYDDCDGMLHLEAPEPSAVSGMKFHDLNGNGVKDPGEPGLEGWTISATDALGNVITTTTDASGNYQFTNIPSGIAFLSEGQQSGWVQTSPPTVKHTVVLTPGQETQNIDFGNTEACQNPTTEGCEAGREDNFDGSDGSEPSSPSQELLDWASGRRANVLSEFDAIGYRRYFLHTFGESDTDTCLSGDCLIVGGKLTITLKAGRSRRAWDDSIGFVQDGQVIWSSRISSLVGGYWGRGRMATITLDLANLPSYQGVTNVLAALQDGEFDLYVQDYTGVDSMQLEVEKCCGECAPPPPNMVAWWPLDETSGRTAADIIGPNNGTHTNGPTPASGIVDNALDFDGVDDYVEVADAPELNFGEGNFSIDAWIQTSDASGFRPIVDKRSPGATDIPFGYTFFLEDGLLGFNIRSDVSPIGSGTFAGGIATTPNLADGRPHFVAVTVQRGSTTGGKLYVDGLLVHTFDTTSFVGDADNNAKLIIASRNRFFGPPVDNFFDGLIDEVELFKRALDVSEIQAIYEAGSAGKCKGAIDGQKFYDLDGDGVKDPNEPGLEGWEITLTGASGNVLTTTTDANGNYSFIPLAAGTYTVTEVQQNGWTQTFPSAPGTHTVTLQAGQVLENIDFGNWRAEQAQIHGMKWYDVNGNGQKDLSEAGLEGWEITLTDASGNILTRTTDVNGNYSFMPVPAGTYTVTEVQQAGWTQTFPSAPGTHTVTLQAGQVLKGIDFGNVKSGKIHGMKFHDLNGNGVKDSDEPGLFGWTIVLEDDDGNRITTVTDEEGYYWFMDLPAGTYILFEVLRDGWAQTFPSPQGTYTVTLQDGQVVENIDFGNWRPRQGQIHGMKWYDLNGNGEKDSDEPGLEGWTITLADANGNVLTTTTDVDGNYWFRPLAAGTYTVTEVQQAGWTQTFPSAPGTHTVTLQHAQVLEGINFGNWRAEQGQIHGIKWYDVNGNGQKDLSEAGLEGWEITLTDASGNVLTRTTDVNGNYSFMPLAAGTYTVTEVQQAGWTQTYPSAPGTHTVTLQDGQAVDNINFGNARSGQIHGMKFNDMNGDGLKDFTEPGLQGWEITLTDANGNISTTTTDVNGNYSFMYLAAGTYTVSEVQQPGWTQTYPSAPGTHTVTLQDGQVVQNIDFGNWTWSAPLPLCDLSISKEHEGNTFFYGQSGVYNLTVSNHGDGSCEGPITMTDKLPTGMSVPSSIFAIGTWSCTADTLNPQTITCTHYGSVPPISSLAQISLTVNVPDASSAGGFGWSGDVAQNCALVNGLNDSNSQNNENCDQVTVVPPSLQ